MLNLPGQINVFSFLHSPLSAGKSFGKSKDVLCIELITAIFQTKNNHFVCLCVLYLFGQAEQSLIPVNLCTLQPEHTVSVYLY